MNEYQATQASDAFNRRDWLLGSGAAVGGALLATSTSNAAEAKRQEPQFSYCLNTSTIRQCAYPGVASGERLTITAAIDVAAEAGYTGIEPWINEITRHTEAGGKLADLRKRIEDRGLTVESAIGFCPWIVNDDATRAKALEAAKRDMEIVSQLGGTRIAAPPVGATKEPGLDLFKAAERYRALLEVGRKVGVVPQLEVWGFSKNLHRLGEAVLVAVESNHPDACLLPDVYHIYKGGSDFGGLGMLGPGAMHVFHMNDYPADPPWNTIRDSDRVYPGDGTAPLDMILRTLAQIGFRGHLSLELFNEDYYRNDAMTVARTGLKKMQSAVRSALA